MKITGIIPARYKSTRFEGKPLADICGKPMIWWVYQQVKKVSLFHDVFVAIDDVRIKDVCEELDIKYVMTASNHPDHIARVQEVSDRIDADYYVCVNGDEPLIDPVAIAKIIPSVKHEGFYFMGARRKIKDPVEVIDPANLKLVLAADESCIYISRIPVPYPKGSILFHYNKYIGIECFSKEALDFFVTTPMGKVEKIEDIDHLRFIENGKKLFFTEVESDSISVDTKNDLEKVKILISRNK
jgi:3-deoxy-manno-octulosonate cytidylyltransferase (CMP-KDO synthetase)